MTRFNGNENFPLNHRRGVTARVKPEKHFASQFKL